VTFPSINTHVKKVLIGLAFGSAGLLTGLLGSGDEQDKVASSVTTAAVFGGLSFAAAEIIGFKNEQEQFRGDVLQTIDRLNSTVRQEAVISRQTSTAMTQVLARATNLVSGRQDLSALDELVLELAESVAAMDENAPPLARAIVVEHVLRAVQCATGPRTGKIVYPGEDRHMLLALAGAAQNGIDAVSPIFGESPDFWVSEFGVSYLELQRRIIAERNVRVRRVFVVDNNSQKSDAVIVAQIADHAALGIDARVLSPEDAPLTLRRRVTNFAVFDGCLSYEMTSSTRFDGSTMPLPTQTTVIFALETVAARQADFQRLWDAAVPVE